MPKTREQELEMMRSYEKWPHRRTLPLVNNNGSVGFLMKEKSKTWVEPIVHHGNMLAWMLVGTPVVRVEVLERFKVFNSFEAIYEAGWRVN